MNKTLLVAQREYLEHLRTKTFWIGILAVPVMIAVTILVGRLLAEAKDVRTYTVLDKSENKWFSQAVAAQSTQGDFQKIFEDVTKDVENAETPEERRAILSATIDENFDEGDPFRELFEILFLELDEDQLAAMEDGNPIAISLILAPYQDRLRKAFEDADPDQLISRFSDLDRSRYQEIPIDQLVPEGSRSDGGGDLEQVLREKLEAGDVFAYFVIADDPVALDHDSRYVSNNVTDDDLRKWFEGHATEVVRKKRIEQLDLSDDEVAMVRARFGFTERKLSSTGEEEDVEAEAKAVGFAPVAFVYLLWIAIFTAANMLLTNTVEEKSNRIIEVLLSSISPFQLMAGKIWGIGAVGLTIVGSWAVFALASIRIAPMFFEGNDSGKLFDVLASAVGNPLYLGSFVAYFFAGFLLYAAVLVAIGSVCNSLKEAQNLMQPVMILLIVPLIAMIPVMNDPNGTVARVLTYIPLFTPFLMMNRAGGPPEMIEYVITSIMLVVTIAFAFVAAGRVFRVGVLMTGKPPKITEIARWMFSGKIAPSATSRGRDGDDGDRGGGGGLAEAAVNVADASVRGTH